MAARFQVVDLNLKPPVHGVMELQWLPPIDLQHKARTACERRVLNRRPVRQVQDKCNAIVADDGVIVRRQQRQGGAMPIQLTFQLLHRPWWCHLLQSRGARATWCSSRLGTAALPGGEEARQGQRRCAGPEQHS